MSLDTLLVFSGYASSVQVKIKNFFFIDCLYKEMKCMFQLTSSKMSCWHKDLKTEIVNNPKQFSVPNLGNTGLEFSSRTSRNVVLPFPGFIILIKWQELRKKLLSKKSIMYYYMIKTQILLFPKSAQYCPYISKQTLWRSPLQRNCIKMFFKENWSDQ